MIVFLSRSAGGEKPERQNADPSRVQGSPAATVLDINGVAAWYSANGEQERLPGSGDAGLFYPAGTFANAVYSAGILWTSRHFIDGQSTRLRTNGQSYVHGTNPGGILGIRTGLAEDPNAPDVRIWRIRRDYRTADLVHDAAYVFGVGVGSVTGAMIDSLRGQYDKDWREWPTLKGAPFYDHDSDGVYVPQFDSLGNPILHPQADEPGLAGADQVIWYVCNDIGVVEPWACPSTGIEEQATIWGYARTDAIGNVIFKRFRLVYKGIGSTPADAHIDSMYVGLWADIDVGDPADDFAGCDSTLCLGYEYNGVPTDAVYSSNGLVPPASGYVVLQGPMIHGTPSDTALFAMRKIPGKKNLPMTAFSFNSQSLFDPPFSQDGANMWNQRLRGLEQHAMSSSDPPPILDPVTGKRTYYWVSGDPVTHSGWVDGSPDPPGDRRILLSSGPFSLAIGDSQEYVTCWVGGLGSNYLSSVTVMKYNAAQAASFYRSLVTIVAGVDKETAESPAEFNLYQNYPNPFNPSTAIRYQLAAFSRVTLKAYNILGQEIRTIVNDYEMPGLHSVTWSGVNDHGTHVSTGVYFYRLTVGGLSQTRKMLLVR